jgi:serine/threonine protein kinase/tetratricopeptide (TPR) repeat protein
MTVAVATLKGQKLDSRYTLLDKLGAGGQGEVWLAHDGTRGIDVALKVVNPGSRSEEAWSALEHEYAIASRLDHPSILKVFAPHKTGDTFVLPMELASGGDLRKLRGGGFLEIIPVLLELAQAMEHAHERGVIHRDLKPGNVLFDARGRVRLADFGVAETASTSREARISASASTSRDTGGQGFSPFTASPAQLRGEPPTPADDIYGLGALAYELLSGYPPYYPHFDKKRAIEERVPDLVPTRQIPPLLGSLVTRMLAKDPKERPRTMREVIDELDAALNDTLTFDFESVSKSSPPAAGSNDPAASDESAVPHDSAPPGTPAQPAAALPSFFAASPSASTANPSPSAAAIADNSTIYLPPSSAAAIADNSTIYLPPTSASDGSAAKTSDEQSKPFKWSPTSGQERRSVPDRRAKPRDGSLAPRIREPKLASDLSGVTSNDTIAWPGPGGDDDTSHSPQSPVSRPGTDALARIDAALERAAAMAAAAPPSSSTSAYGRSPVARTTERSHFINPTQTEAAADEPVSKSQAAKPQPLTSKTSAPPSSAVPPQELTQQRTQNPSTHAERTTSAPTTAASRPRATAEHTLVTPPSSSAAMPNSTAAADPHPITVGQYQPTAITQPLTAGQPSMSARASSMNATWGGIPLDGLPRVARLEPIESARWPWVVLGLLAGGAAAVYFWLPKFDLQALPPSVSAVIAPLQSALDQSSGTSARQSASAVPTASAGQSQSASPATSTGPVSNESEEQQLHAMRRTFDSRLAALEARDAGVWGGHDFAMAKTRAAESVGAHDAGNPRMARDRLAAAIKLLDSVESKAPQALSAEIAVGEKALGSGQQEVASQAFELARRIDPTDRRASDGLRRAQNLNGVLPLLADARNAEAAHDYARAAQDYSQALSLDQGNAAAKAGQSRADAAFGDDNYAKAVGAGFAALGAGRLDDARASFIRARALKPNGAEAADGLRRVQAALTARGFAAVRQRAADLEAQERWDDAQQAYEDVLASDPSLGFAQEGRARAASRADLGIRLQQLIDRPDRLSAPGVRVDARALLETAEAQSPSGPVLRSQIARLQMLLPGYDKPVRLSLVSDNSTQVAIWSVGSFGAFSRRDIELRPGKYTVVGTRNGFRDVRREITVAPGQDTQTIKVTCSEPI